MDTRTSPEYMLAMAALAVLALAIISLAAVAIVWLRRHTPPIANDEAPDVIPFELRRRT